MATRPPALNCTTYWLSALTVIAVQGFASLPICARSSRVATAADAIDAADTPDPAGPTFRSGVFDEPTFKVKNRLPMPAALPRLSITSQPVVCKPFDRLSAVASMMYAARALLVLHSPG